MHETVQIQRWVTDSWLIQNPWTSAKARVRWPLFWILCLLEWTRPTHSLSEFCCCCDRSFPSCFTSSLANSIRDWIRNHNYCSKRNIIWKHTEIFALREKENETTIQCRLWHPKTDAMKSPRRPWTMAWSTGPSCSSPRWQVCGLPWRIQPFERWPTGKAERR